MDPFYSLDNLRSMSASVIFVVRAQEFTFAGMEL